MMVFAAVKRYCLAHYAAIQGFFFLCTVLFSASPVLAETSFPCDLFFDVSSDLSADGSSKGLQCNVRFFCLNASSACACSDASQPMFSFDLPFAFSADDDLQSGLATGDVIIVPNGKDNVTQIPAAFDASNQTEGGMCAMIETGFSLKVQSLHDQSRLLRSLVLSVMGRNCDDSQRKFADALFLSAAFGPSEGPSVNIVALNPGLSKLSIPASASFQITVNNLASIGSPLYINFNRAGDASRPSDTAIAVWELDGWWQPAVAESAGAGSMRTTVVIIVCVIAVLAIFTYRFFFGSSGRERRAQLKMTTSRMRNLFSRNLHRRAERKEREREERKPIFQEDHAVSKGNSMNLDTFLDIGADDDDEAPGRGPGAL